MPRHLEEKKIKKNLYLVGGAVQDGTFASVPSATVSPKQHLLDRICTIFAIRLLWILIKKYFGPRLSEICIFFYYEMKNNRDALS